MFMYAYVCIYLYVSVYIYIYTHMSCSKGLTWIAGLAGNNDMQNWGRSDPPLNLSVLAGLAPMAGLPNAGSFSRATVVFEVNSKDKDPVSRL